MEYALHLPLFYKEQQQQQPFNGLFSRTTWVIQYQKGKTNLDFTGARDSEWQWHQLGHMQVCTSLQTDNHTSTPPLCFLQAGCPSCHPTNSIKALKANSFIRNLETLFFPFFLLSSFRHNHACNLPISFSQAGCPSCRPTNNVKALKG